ncbi:MAG: hypothetical protein VYE68_15375 [Acidobacteriota bacterium]|nr:hypothetical protein [Acidobacteriota bacterium]
MTVDSRRRPKRGPGRPPAGKDGVAVTKTYVQTTLRLDPETKDLLDALTRLLGQPQRQVAGEALTMFAGRLTPSDRALLRGLLHRKG